MQAKVNLVFLVIVVLSSFSFISYSQTNSTSDDIRIVRHQAVKMSDGIILYADLYLPAEPGKYPTIVSSSLLMEFRETVHMRCL